LPKTNEEEKRLRTAAIQDATRYATEVPFKTMQKAYECFGLCEAMVKTGNPNSITDAGVGALCCRTAITGALLNVRINTSGLSDKNFAADIISKANEIEKLAIAKENEIIDFVKSKI